MGGSAMELMALCPSTYAAAAGHVYVRGFEFTPPTSSYTTHLVHHDQLVERIEIGGGCAAVSGRVYDALDAELIGPLVQFHRISGFDPGVNVWFQLLFHEAPHLRQN
jgi:hypothetical protein